MHTQTSQRRPPPGGFLTGPDVRDTGDAREWAESPVYPGQITALAYRCGINYIIYAMTH